MSKEYKLALSILDRYAKRTKRKLNKELVALKDQVDALTYKLLHDIQLYGELTPTTLYSRGFFITYKSQMLNAYTKLITKASQIMQDNLLEAFYVAYSETFEDIDIETFRQGDFEKHFKQYMAKPLQNISIDTKIDTQLMHSLYGMENSLQQGIAGALGIAFITEQYTKYYTKISSDLERLVETELMYAINTAQRDKYRDLGYTHFIVLVEYDERTCANCESREGEIYPITAETPPFHPRCRCGIEPITL